MTNPVDTVRKTRVLDTPVFGRDDGTLSGCPAMQEAATVVSRLLDAASHEPTIFLVIHDFVERVPLLEKLSAVIGRADLKTNFLPDVDLTRYGARAQGVSRAHARLHRRGLHFYISDLCSDNGTFIGGKRLVPDVPYILGSGEEVVLGCLKARVLFS